MNSHRADKVERTGRGLRPLESLTRWWWQPVRWSELRTVRGGLSLLTAAYFLDALSDLGVWFGEGGLHSASRVDQFLRSAGLEQEAAASVSPLFWVDSYGMYVLFVLLAIVFSLTVTAVDWGGARFSRFVSRPGVRRGLVILPWVIWLCIVAWANRLLWLSGLTETLLSWTWFAVAIAGSSGCEVRPVPGEPIEVDNAPRSSATAGFGMRLLALQGSLLVFITWVSMLTAPVWWNGTGAVALSAATDHRTVNWLPLLAPVWMHESVTHALIVAMPLGLWMAWRPAAAARRVGIGVLTVWAVVVALLGSHWVYGGLLILAFRAIGAVNRSDALAMPAVEDGLVDAAKA